MNFFPLTCFVSAFLAGCAGFFVLLVNPKNKLHQSWFFLNFGIVIWLIGLGFTMIVNKESTALFWQKVLYIGTILIPVYFVDFCTFLTKYREKGRRVFRLNLLFAIFFLLSLLGTNLFIKEIKEMTHFGYWPVEVGWLYYPFLLWFATAVIYGFFLLRKGYRNKELDAIQRQQILFMFYGTLIGFSAGSLNFLLDFNIRIPPIYNFLVPFYLVFVGYAIITKRLFGIKVILTEILVGIIAILLLVNTLVSETVFDYLWKGMTFVLFLVFGHYLIKATHREVRQKEILEEKVQERTKELQVAYEDIKKRKEDLEKFYKLTVGRELRMIELKKQIKELEKKMKEEKS